jgi:hypothetical protein
VTSEVTSALAKSLKLASDFGIAVEKLKAQILEDWKKQVDLSRSIFQQLVENIQDAAQRVFSAIDTRVDESSVKLSLLQEACIIPMHNLNTLILICHLGSEENPRTNTHIQSRPANPARCCCSAIYCF